MDKYKNITTITNIAIFVLTALLSGFGSAWLILENGSRLTSNVSGQWKSWRSAGRPDADPYARAHLARSGRLPISSSSIQYYMAKTDTEGLRLLGSCEYVVENSETVSDWWSLTVFNDGGRLQPNSAGRYAFNSSTILRGTDGKYSINLASSPRPGNWLPTKIGDKLTLLFRLHKPAPSELTTASRIETVQLPAIRRVKCG